MSHPAWVLLQPGMMPEDLGPYLPFFLVVEDQRPAAEQFNERYKFGGWRPYGQDQFTMTKGYGLMFPGDPVQQPRALTRLRNETIILYPHDVFAIVQKDGSFEVSRMD